MSAIYYTTQPKDTWFQLSKISGLSTEVVASMKNKKTTDILQVGEKFEFPLKTCTVEKGNTLTSIAKPLGISAQALADINHMKTTDILQIGQVLITVPYYDAIIQFVDSQKLPIAWTNYILRLENGQEIYGVSDDNGFADRVFTNIPMAIVDIEFPYEEYFEEYNEENNGEEW